MIRKTLTLMAEGLMLSGMLWAQVPGQTQRPENDYIVRGKILFGTPHAPDQRLQVSLEKAGMQVIATAFTDTVGNFEFRNLQPGAYYVYVNVEGYEEVRQQVEIYSSLGRVINVTIFLNEKHQVIRKEGGGFVGDDPNTLDVKQLARNFPKKAVQEYEKAIKDSEKGKNDSAIKRLEEAVRLAPDFYHAHNNLGVQYQKTKRFEDAEREFNRARELNQRAAQPLINLGSLYLEQGDPEHAVEVLEKAVRVNPRSALAFYYLGSALYKASMFEQAENSLKRAYELNEKMSMVRLMLANVYLKLKKYDSVLGQLDAFLRENPTSNERPAVEDMRSRLLKGLNK